MMTKQLVLGFLVFLAPVLLGAEGGCEKVEFKLDLDIRSASLPAETREVRCLAVSDGSGEVAAVLVGADGQAHVWACDDFSKDGDSRKAHWRQLCSGPHEDLRVSWKNLWQMVVLRRDGDRTDAHLLARTGTSRSLTIDGDLLDSAAGDDCIAVVRPWHGHSVISWIGERKLSRPITRLAPVHSVTIGFVKGVHSLHWVEQYAHANVVMGVEDLELATAEIVSSRSERIASASLVLTNDGSLAWREGEEFRLSEWERGKERLRRERTENQYSAAASSCSGNWIVVRNRATGVLERLHAENDPPKPPISDEGVEDLPPR